MQVKRKCFDEKKTLVTYPLECLVSHYEAQEIRQKPKNNTKLLRSSRNLFMSVVKCESFNLITFIVWYPTKNKSLQFFARANMTDVFPYELDRLPPKLAATSNFFEFAEFGTAVHVASAICCTIAFSGSI